MIGISQIWDRLFLGSLYDAERFAKANPPRHRGRRVAIRDGTLQHALWDLYVHLPVGGGETIPIPQFDAIIGALAENPRRGKVLIHGGSGISRAPVMTAAWMHAVGYKSLDAALLEIAELRPIIAPSAIIIASVK